MEFHCCGCNILKFVFLPLCKGSVRYGTKKNNEFIFFVQNLKDVC